MAKNLHRNLHASLHSSVLHRAKLARRRERERAEREDIALCGNVSAGGGRAVPLARTLAEAARASAAGPRDLTAALCGDPLPGRSALDHKRGPGHG